MVWPEGKLPWPRNQWPAALEPGIGIIAVEADDGGPETPVDVLHHDGDELGIGHGFSRQQRRLSRFFVLADQPRRVERDRDQSHPDGCVIARNHAIEAEVSGAIAEVTPFDRIDRHHQRDRHADHGERGNEGGPMAQVRRKQPDVPLIAEEVGRQLFPRHVALGSGWRHGLGRRIARWRILRAELHRKRQSGEREKYESGAVEQKPPPKCQCSS